ncbi:hypothetical protein LYSHEL_25530 [Lysobacter helvus]|uniref:Uncharacterized protein n=2 Tax=Lysobacteraceae TaxID=32033 RepID=A0ABM7Q822_9GAMM|nr:MULTISPECIES: hypothetical protein [Lysobacter]BCT93529.1 hypothetical protein LYSCAS_25530 [Lysobacter caseinilyticus]BCT96682.1 hypothetical protein LYSHEL_25530 [Lysobacter helvus]
MDGQIRIGEQSRPLSEASNDWINSQISGRQKDGPVCVQIQLTSPMVNVTLTTGACKGSVGGGGGRRAPNEQERELLDAWEARGLNATTFNHGKLVSFINSLR